MGGVGGEFEEAVTDGEVDSKRWDMRVLFTVR